MEISKCSGFKITDFTDTVDVRDGLNPPLRKLFFSLKTKLLNDKFKNSYRVLKDIFGDSADLRFFNEPNRSFHAKSYFFEYEDGAEMYIGSSNLSRSAFTIGVEWNFRLDKLTHEVEYEQYYSVFEDLFYNHSIQITDAELDFYSKNWKKNKIYKTIPFQHQEESQMAA